MENYNNNSKSVGQSTIPCSQTKAKRNFFTELERVKEQVQYQNFPKTTITQKHTVYPYDEYTLEITEPFYHEICFVIAEVYISSSKSKVRVAGSDLDADDVKDVFSLLSHKHIEFVVKNYKQIQKRVINKKAYWRTALYNSVFELFSDALNDGNICKPSFDLTDMEKEDFEAVLRGDVR